MGRSNDPGFVCPDPDYDVDAEVGPFEILERVGEVAYRIALPPSLDSIHNVFHVSQLRRYI